MAEKKKSQKAGAKKAPVRAQAAKKPVVKKATKVAPQTKKVDIVEEAKKELKKMEAEKAEIKTAKKTGGFAWGTFIGAVLLTAAAFILGNMVNSEIQKKKINEFLPELIGGLGGGMKLDNTGPLTEESGLYKFTIKFADYEEEFTSAITKDGKYFFVDMSYEVPQLLEEIRGNTSADGSDSTTTTCENITKTEAPQLDIYVSSDCGHCKQLEGQANAAVKQVPALANNIKLRYVGGVNEDGQAISLFGTTEGGEENLRQVCIRDKNPAAFWDYVGCMADGGETEACQQTARVETWTVNQCMTDGTGIAAITADNEAATAHNVTGTPTLYINDNQQVSDIDFGGRVPDSYKQIVCCGSITQADFCSQTLTDPTTAAE